MDVDLFGGLAYGLAAVHDGCLEAVGELFGELVGLVATIDVDGFPGRVDDDVAVAARAEVLFYFGQQLGINLSVEIVG